MACHERAKRVEWRRGDSNPKDASTETLQLNGKTATEPNGQPSERLLAKHNKTLPTQKNNSFEHQTGANMVHEIIDTSSDSDLEKIIMAWTALPDHVKQTISTLVDVSKKK